MQDRVDNRLLCLRHKNVSHDYWMLDTNKIIGILFSPYRHCAADIRRLNFPDSFPIMSGKKCFFSITFSRKRPLTIMCRQYVVQFQLGTTRLLRFIDFQLAVENTASNGCYYTVLYTILPLKMVVYYIFTCWMISW